MNLSGHHPSLDDDSFRTRGSDVGTSQIAPTQIQAGGKGPHTRQEEIVQPFCCKQGSSLLPELTKESLTGRETDSTVGAGNAARHICRRGLIAPEREEAWFSSGAQQKRCLQGCRRQAGPLTRQAEVHVLLAVPLGRLVC